MYLSSHVLLPHREGHTASYPRVNTDDKNILKHEGLLKEETLEFSCIQKT